MGQGMAGQGMTGGATMNQMATRHQQMTELMNKLTQSMAALESEKDPAALQSKLAEHRALLEQMRTHMTQQGGMMQRMAAQVQNCPMMGQTAQPPTQ
jgi:hemerythrin-like domain-containing protein